MKHILLASLLFIQLFSLGQVQTYDASILSDSLYARVHRMECMFYNAAITGKIKAYKNDSLTSFFQPGILKQFVKATILFERKGDSFHINNPGKIIEFDPIRDGKGLCSFYKTVKTSSITSTQQTINLSALAVMYTPYLSVTDIRNDVQPMFFIRYMDLKSLLSSSDMNLVVLLSNLLMTDKGWNNYQQKGDSIKTSSDNFYGAGIHNEFKKSSFMNKESLKSIAHLSYDQTVSLLRYEILTFHSNFYSDASLKIKYNLDSLNALVTTRKSIRGRIGIEQKNPSGDTTYMANLWEKDFNYIRITTTSIGITTFNVPNKTIYMHREDFNRIAPQWLKVIYSVVSSE
jgi:hypothetical protein